MKRPVKILIIACGSIVALWIIGRLTNVIQFYSIPTPSNEPTIMEGSYIFASNLKKPERFDFICYNYSDGISPGKSMFVKRLCGIEGDTIEIRNGDLFVNNKSVDTSFTLYHSYLVSQKDLEYLKDKKKLDKKNIMELMTDTMVTVLISKEMAADKNISPKRKIAEKGFVDEEISRVFKQGWNRDNFGPLVVPKGKYFVMGDSRDNSFDSRYTGFINKSDFLGTKL